MRKTERNMSGRKLGSLLSLAGVLVLIIALFAVVMTAMGTRLDNQDPSAKDPSPAEVERQTLAQTVARIEVLAGERSAELWTAVPLVDASAQWNSVLGDVWVPWPDGPPEGYENPEINVTPSEISDTALITELYELSEALIAAEELDPQLATSMAASARIYAYHLSVETGAGTANGDDICGSVNYAALGALTADESSLEIAETARQYFEFVAANTDPGNRFNEVARGEAVVNLVDAILEQGVADIRPTLVMLPEDPLFTGYQMLADHLIVLADDADAEQRRAIVSFMCTISTPGDAALDVYPTAFPGITAEEFTD